MATTTVSSGVSVFLFFFSFFFILLADVIVQGLNAKKKIEKNVLGPVPAKAEVCFCFFDLNRFISEAEVGNVASGDLLLLLLVLWNIII